MTVAIRELGSSDVSALRELMDAVVPGWSERYPPPPDGEAIFLANESTFVLGAYEGESPVGWAWAVGIRRPNGWCMTYLHQLDVVESHRRQGIASMLIESAKEVARREGSSQLWLSTGRHNEVAQALYDHLGGDRKPDGDVNYWWDL